MKIRLAALFLVATAVCGESPPRLVPRPIPGLVIPPRSGTTQIMRRSPSSGQAAAAPAPQFEGARIVRVRRAATLPEDMRLAAGKDPAARIAEGAAQTVVIQERQPALRIIPKSEIATLAASAEISQTTTRDEKLDPQ